MSAKPVYRITSDQVERISACLEEIDRVKLFLTFGLENREHVEALQKAGDGIHAILASLR